MLQPISRNKLLTTLDWLLFFILCTVAIVFCWPMLEEWQHVATKLWGCCGLTATRWWHGRRSIRSVQQRGWFHPLPPPPTPETRLTTGSLYQLQAPQTRSLTSRLSPVQPTARTASHTRQVQPWGLSGLPKPQENDSSSRGTSRLNVVSR